MYDSHLSLFFIPRLLCGVSRLCYRLVMKLAELNALYLCWHVLWLKLFLCTAFLRKRYPPPSPFPTPVATLGIWRRKKESVVLTALLDHDVDPLPNPSPVCVDDTVWLDIDPLPNPLPCITRKRTFQTTSFPCGEFSPVHTKLIRSSSFSVVKNRAPRLKWSLKFDWTIFLKKKEDRIVLCWNASVLKLSHITSLCVGPNRDQLWKINK